MKQQLGRRAFLLALGATSAARALPVIPAGSEERVLALFAPYRLAGEVTLGWRLWNVSIEPSEIGVELRGPAAESARFRLTHDTATAERTLSFGVVRDPNARDVGAARATDALVAAIRRNDRADFWTEAPPSRAFETRAGPDQSARGIALPFLVAAVTLISMWSVRRLTCRPARPPSTRSS